MALTQEDVKFVMAIMPDMAKMQSALTSLGKEVSEKAKKAGQVLQDEMIKGMSAAGKAASPWSVLTEKLSSAGREQLESQKLITAELEKQAVYTNKFIAAMSSAAQKTDSWSMGLAEMDRQKAELAGMPTATKAPGMFDKLLAGLGVGKEGGVNKNQFLGSILGGLEGGGIKGGLGAGVGSIVGAMGGPAGLIIAAAPIIAKKLGELAATPFKVIAGGFDLISTSLKDLQGPLGPIGAGLSAMSGAIKGAGGLAAAMAGPVVGEFIKPIADALGAIPQAISSVVESLTSMTRLASPGAFKMWTMALEDVQGVIGGTFVPVLNMMRDAVRLFGDILATVLPNMEEMDDALSFVKMAFAELGSAVRDVFSEVGPLIREFFIANIKLLGVAIYSVVMPISYAIKAFAWLAGQIKEFVSFITMGAINLGQFGGMRSSVGAAARQAQIQGLDEYQRQLQISAFSQPGINPQERTADAAEGILEWLRNNANRGVVAAGADVLNQAQQGVARAIAGDDAAPAVNAGLVIARRAMLGF